ncbi:MAG TPA: relaxase/mobilization nuclease domain-containing protein [Chitinophagales bacterium]|nr:relaxase/mobilization nuclease domain-containing protein [Chitinophagales bacterium]
MIIKIKSHKRAAFKQVLSYMLDHRDRLYDKDKSSFAVTHNLKGKSIDKWVKQFDSNEASRRLKRKDSVRLTHEILSWHKADAKHLTLEKLETIAREYIKQRNPNGMYVVVPHFDKHHFHLHVCASGVEYKTGKSLRLSKPDLQRLKVEVQRYQLTRFPELSNSTVDHSKNVGTRVSDKEVQFKRRTGRETEKEKLIGMLKTCYKKADSRERFYELLEECGLETYVRGGRVYGVVLDGVKFRFGTLGYTEERFDDLDQFQDRNEGLTQLRRDISGPAPNQQSRQPDVEERERSEADAGLEDVINEGATERLNELDALRKTDDPQIGERATGERDMVDDRLTSAPFHKRNL